MRDGDSQQWARGRPEGFLLMGRPEFSEEDVRNPRGMLDACVGVPAMRAMAETRPHHTRSVDVQAIVMRTMKLSDLNFVIGALKTRMARRSAR